jgi:transcriptional antiterminator NusG
MFGVSDELENNPNPSVSDPSESNATNGQAESSSIPADSAPEPVADAAGTAPVSDIPADDDSPIDAIIRGPAFSENDEATPLEEIPSSPDDDKPVVTGERHWYILKVQVNREDAIRDALERRIRVAGLQDFFGDLVVPDEKRTEFKNGKKKVVRVKLYPGYLIVHMELNDATWFLVRETSGIGDFTNAGGKPSPMSPSDVAKIIKKTDEKTEEAPKLKIPYKPGDRVRINDGMFANFEGSVEGIDETNGRVTVMINIFGRSTPVELEYWQIENL